jgi:hypothetical protein
MAFLSAFVGVGKYADPAVRDLVGSTRDAVALHALFADSFPGSSPTLLSVGSAIIGVVEFDMSDFRKMSASA